MRYRETVRSGGALLWFFQRLSGVFLAVVLFLHVYILHVALKDELAFHAIADRVATPFWKMIDISFLIVALFHGLYGAWIVFDDYIHRGWMRITIFSILSIVALLAVTLGILTILPFQAGG
jgi:succinate dehydrogenase / fumarate reductase membrane anchor subunit